MKNARILVTGSAGAVGFRVALGLLERGHEVHGFDLRPQRLPGDHCRASLLHFDALRSAAKGMDAIVHLAGAPDRQAFAASLVPNNIIGTHNVFEVARLEGVGRVVNTSSIRVVGGLDWAQHGLKPRIFPPRKWRPVWCQSNVSDLRSARHAGATYLVHAGERQGFAALFVSRR